MRIETEGTDQLSQIIGEVGMRHDFLSEKLVLIFRGEFAVNLKSGLSCQREYQEVCGLEEVGFLRQFLDRVATVTKNAF